MIDFLTKTLDSISAKPNGILYSDFDLDGKIPGKLPPGKAAAVLLPLLKRADEWQVLLTVRSQDMPTHSGQISFPGGKYQPSDVNLSRTALREFEEETGIGQSQVNILGRFDEYHTVTDFRITPFVGVIEGDVRLNPDPREVSEVFEVPFAFLRDLQNFQLESIVWQGKERSFYSIPWQERYIWGATAGMLRMLAIRLAEREQETCDD